MSIRLLICKAKYRVAKFVVLISMSVEKVREWIPQSVARDAKLVGRYACLLTLNKRCFNMSSMLSKSTPEELGIIFVGNDFGSLTYEFSLIPPHSLIHFLLNQPLSP